MTKASRTFVHHYAGVAIIVGLLSSFGTWTATRFVTASSAQPAPAAATPLLVQPLADLPGREVRIALLDRAPGSSSPPHRHPGHHTFGYVIKGDVEKLIEIVNLAVKLQSMLVANRKLIRSLENAQNRSR